MDFKKYSLSVAMGSALLAVTAMSASATYVYEFETAAGGVVSIDAISGTDSAVDYYNYFASSGHPDFGTATGAAFFWLYEETDTNLLSMNVIFNHADQSQSGTVNHTSFDVTGLPASYSWSFRDDSNDSAFAWTWNNRYTDGGVLGGFASDTWEVNWLALGLEGINSLAFVSGNGYTTTGFDLSVGETLTIRATEANPVPEPATMLLFGAGLAAITGLRKRKK